MLFYMVMDIFKIDYGNFLFNISTMSFYQVNPIQTEKLYSIAINSAEICKDDVVFDLYSGIGTIGIFASKFAKRVYGIEIINDAVENAKTNARINNIQNIEFFAGDVEESLSFLIYNKGIKPDVVFVDPPRKGLDKTSIGNLIRIKPKKIVYISCNPTTLVRDLAMLEDTYEIKSATPVDLFPWTGHVECVAMLQLK